jgi:hypothetical protein
MRKISLFIGLLLVGCAADQSMPPLGDDHPANPAAPTAPLERSTTLATSAATEPATKPATATEPATRAGIYVCPMHPQVTSNDPSARCHICGMRLVPRKGGTR